MGPMRLQAAPFTDPVPRLPKPVFEGPGWTAFERLRRNGKSLGQDD